MNIFYWDRMLLQQWLESHPIAIDEVYTQGHADSIVDWTLISENPHYESILQEIHAEANRLKDISIPDLTEELYLLFEQTGNRLAYENVYFERRRRLTTFALLHAVYADEPLYVQQLHDTIAAILQEKTWCLPAHMKGQGERHIDLFAAETGFALSEIIILAGNRLPESLVEHMKEHIELRLFNPYLNDGPFHWEKADHNWASVCAGSIGAAALLLEQDAARKALICSKAIDTMCSYLSGFGQDGVCLEGPGYWNYGFGYYVYFADLLKRSTGGNADLFNHNKVKSIALFQQKCYLIHNRPVNFSDAMPFVNVNIGLSDYLASYYKDMDYVSLEMRSAYSEDHCARFAPALRSLIWYRPQADRKDYWEPGSWYMSDAQWLMSRLTNDHGSFAFAAKGGTNNEPHNHNDIGHFIMLADDDPAFLVDLGCGEYTADYFGAERYSYACTGAQGHSVPIINNRLQASGAESYAKVVQVSTSEAEDRFSMDLTSCYPHSELFLYKRSFHWVKSELPVLTLTDEFYFQAPSIPIIESFVTRCCPHSVSTGLVILQGSKHSIMMEYEPSQFELDIQELSFSNHFGKQESYYRIQLVAHSVQENKYQAILRFKFQ